MEFPLSFPPCTAVTQPPTPPPTSPLMQSPSTPPPAPLKEPTPTPFMQPRSPFLPSPLTQPRAPPSPIKRPPLTSPTCTSPSSPSPLRPISKATWDRDNYGHCWESFITTTTTTSTTPTLTLHTTLLHTPSPILPPLFPISPPAPFPILPAGTFPIPPPPPFAIIPSPTPFSPYHFPTSSTPFASIPSTIMNSGGDMLGWSGTPGIPLGQPRSSSFSRGRLRGRGGRGRRGGGGGEEKEEGELECVFCKKNGEMKEFYSTHVLKDPFGMVICPVLRAYVCPNCGASGYHAHTLSHCPLAGHPPPLPPVVRRRRTSCGKKIFLPDHKFY
ncbi:hypothetical protein V1264_001294 [Littorina saxatilis]|uniref:Nanos-type domain-containing protein n=1 Tax=Littorina saxatilis TaxID=31220 RepID=A0AAN9C169_9CAEN